MKIKLGIIIVCILLGINANAYTWTDNIWGINTDSEWKSRGVNTIEEAKEWFDIGIQSPSYQIAEFKKLGLSPSKVKEWESLCHNRQGYKLECIEKYLNLNINANEALEWEKVVSTPRKVDGWIKLGITDLNQIKAWIKFTGMDDSYYSAGWIEAGVMSPKEATQWKNVGISNSDIKRVKEANITIQDLNSEYKNIKLDYVIKLKNWGFTPDKLIKSMIASDKIFNQILFFNDQNTFENAYDNIRNVCDEIVLNKYFSNVSASESKDKCFIFAGHMKQRLDDSEMNGIVNGLSNKDIYIRGIKNDWEINRSRIGVIYGDGVYKFNTPSGKVISMPGGFFIF